jgi:uncharacterized protein (TIGR00251 family)
MKRSEYPFLRFTEDALILDIYVQPRASRNQLCGVQGDELKLRLTSPPVDGAANKLCREFIADLLDVSRSAVTIISGESSRHKRIRVNSSNLEQLINSVETMVASAKIMEPATTKGCKHVTSESGG